MKNVCMIGSGYVGLVTGACFEYLENSVICVDTDPKKIKMLQSGVSTIYEDGLQELINNSTNLKFSTDLKSALEQSEIIFVCVGTPEDEDGNANLSFVYSACETIAQNLIEGQTIVIKSTMPVTAVSKVKEILNKANVNYNLVSNPEFLAQGTAIKDFLNPDRIVIGSDNDDGYNQVAELYKSVDAPIVKTDIASAIISKYAANAFLATKVSFINSIALLCEKVGANIKDVSTAMGHDKRIGNKFLNAGVGYGGSCFPKDTKALVKTGEEVGLSLDILKAVVETNKKQRMHVLEKLKKHLINFEGKKLCFLGLAFKPGTDDLRESPALYLADDLKGYNVKITAYDPVVKSLSENDNIEVVSEVYEAVDGVDAIIVITEHSQFFDLDFNEIKRLSKGNILIDGRNCLDSKVIENSGFIYEGIGI